MNIKNIPKLPKGIVRQCFDILRKNADVNNTEAFHKLYQNLRWLNILYDTDEEKEKEEDMAYFILTSCKIYFPHLLSHKLKKKLREIH